MFKIALIVPAYGHYDYVLRTVTSFFEHTPPGSCCYVIDDGSPDWKDIDWSKFPPHVQLNEESDLQEVILQNKSPLVVYRYDHNRGLTRSWNLGLQLGKNTTEYMICGNSDILFTPLWYEPLIEALEECDLVGPTTNATGRVTTQNIAAFNRNYVLTDDATYLAELSSNLRSRYGSRRYDLGEINGFFMMAKTPTWWSGAHNSEFIFNPHSRMDNVAYKMQNNWRKMKRKIGVVPGSFIFHYRSVSRGKRGLLGRFGKGSFRAKP